MAKGKYFKMHHDGELLTVCGLDFSGDGKLLAAAVIDNNGHKTWLMVNEELLQFTGIKDKNDIEIYDRHICDISTTTSTTRSVIVFEDGCFKLIKMSDETFYFTFDELVQKLESGEIKSIEIVGHCFTDEYLLDDFNKNVIEN